MREPSAYVEQLEPRCLLTAPAVQSVTNFGENGEVLNVWGSGFSGATAVNFVNTANASLVTPAAAFQVVNSGLMHVTVPTATPTGVNPGGTYHIEVTTGGGTSSPTAADVFSDAANLIPTTVAATIVQSLGGPVTLPGTQGASIADIPVLSTADFAPTGDLFVKTTNGVATIHYTGITGTSFTGCTVVGDVKNVGADDLSGTFDNKDAIFQATNQRFTITIANETNLPPGAQNAINGVMYWNSTGGSYYYLDASGKYEHAPATAGQTIPAFTPQQGLDGSLQLSIPYMPINSMRMYFGVGAPLDIESNGSGITAPNDTTATNVIDFVEGTFDASGADSVVPLSVRNFATFNVNTTQVDQFGMPITLTGDVYSAQDAPTSASVGVTVSPNVARDKIFQQFEALHPSSTDPYGTLVVPSSDPSQPLRILNPSNLNLTRSTPLAYAFDGLIKNLFENPTAGSPLTLTTASGNYSGVAGRDPTNTYNVLKFTGPNGTLYVYEPFFQTNSPTPASLSTVSYAGKPSAPSWLQNANETPGQMVLANNGVFSDANNPADHSRRQPGLTAAQRIDLGAIEDDLVAALNRGVSSLPTSEWSDSTKFYVTDPVSNQYASFLHTAKIDGVPIFIDGKAYAIAFDDNNGYAPYLSFMNQNGIQVTLGPWQTSGPSGDNGGFLTAVYQDVLHRAVDPAGRTYWLNLLSAGRTRDQVSLGIVNSAEARTDLIEGFYSSLLHRNADAQGVVGYLQLFERGWNSLQIKSLFFGSPEYFQLHGGTDSGFIDGLYQDEFNRAAGDQAQAALGGLLAGGQSRTYAATLVVASPEAEADQVDVYYVSYLLRPADPAGLAYWNRVLAETERDDLVQSGLLGSTEYFNRT